MRRYGSWAGNEKGNPEDTTKCIVEVHDSSRGCLSHQCRRKRGHGPDGLYCKQHAMMVINGDRVRVPKETP